MRFKLLVLATVVLIALPLQAQTDKPWQWHFGLGWPAPTGSTSDVAKGVFHVMTGAIHEFNPKLGVRIDGEYSRFYPTSAVTEAYDTSGGHANVWSLSADLQYKMTESGRATTYLFGGVGTHYKQTYLTNPGVGWWCDPWWGICYPVGTDVIDEKKTDTAFGANAGIGVSWPMISGTSFFLEAKYQWVNGDKKAAQYVPLIVGWRW